MKFKLSKYIIPSVISMVLVGTYTNIDGLFIGNVTGDPGLAAINIVWPIVALITSLGTGIGLGGSVILSNAKGKGDIEGARKIKSTVILTLISVGILSGIIFTLVYNPLLHLMGAEGDVLGYASDYAKVVCLGAVFQILGSGLVVILRTENKTYFSMLCCLIGLIVHIILDILLVEKYTLMGVAISTVVSQAVIMILALVALWEKKIAPIDTKSLIPILAASTSPIGINFVPSVVLLLTNYFALAEGGTAAVSAYAVMSYAIYTFDYIFQGVCDGVQPVISYSVGSKDNAEKLRAMKVSEIILTISSLAFIASTPLLIYIMPKIFAVSKEAEMMMNTGFIIYAFSYPFKAAVKYIGSYYYAIGKNTISNLLVYSDPLVFTPILLILFSWIMGMNGVWLSLTLSQVCVTAFGALSFFVKKKKIA